MANGLREARTQIANTINGLRTGQQDVGINVAVNAILNVGNSDYSNSATVAIRTSSGTVTIGGPSNKCNCLVASTFARGAGLGFIRNGQHWGAGINTTAFEVEAARNRLYSPGDLALSESQRRIAYDAAGNQVKDTDTGYGTATFDGDNRIVAIQDKFAGSSTYTSHQSGDAKLPTFG